ncbi:MAG TPA: hypothetical protein VFB78_11470 [Acidimicrobiales bacterium]|nr:hypothetical protein [Acidimicrobiales bacterium]
MKRRSVLTFVLLAALVLGACGGGKSDDTSVTIGTDDSPASAGPPTPGQTTATTQAPAGRAIAAPWSAPTSGVAALIARAGLPALPSERLTYHIHAHVTVFVDGDSKAVPANLGIDLQRQVISPLHTHDDTGIIHVENDQPADFFLGQLFDEWNVRFNATCVGSYCKPGTDWAVYLDGAKDTDDPRLVQFSPHREITIVIGKAPKDIPTTYDWPSGV